MHQYDQVKSIADQILAIEEGQVFSLNVIISRPEKIISFTKVLQNVQGYLE